MLIPDLPMAFAFWSPVILIIAFFSSASTLIPCVMAGLKARVMNTSGIGEYSIQSMFSSFSSRLTALIRTPLTPTAAPIGSTFICSVFRAIFARSPGILAALIISTTPSSISGTSDAIRASKNLGEVRVSSRKSPYSGSTLTYLNKALILSPRL